MGSTRPRLHPLPPGKGFPVRTKRHVPNQALILGEGAFLHAGVHIPQPYHFVVSPTGIATRAGKGFPIRTERHAIHLHTPFSPAR